MHLEQQKLAKDLDQQDGKGAFEQPPYKIFIYYKPLPIK
jgi:hypothetical protein